MSDISATDVDGADLQRTCTRKKGYPTQETAGNSVASIRRTNPTADVRVYACRRCGLWHVGRTPASERSTDLPDPPRSTPRMSKPRRRVFGDIVMTDRTVPRKLRRRREEDTE